MEAVVLDFRGFSEQRLLVDNCEDVGGSTNAHQKRLPTISRCTSPLYSIYIHNCSTVGRKLVSPPEPSNFYNGEIGEGHIYTRRHSERCAHPVLQGWSYSSTTNYPQFSWKNGDDFAPSGEASSKSQSIPDLVLDHLPLFAQRA